MHFVFTAPRYHTNQRFAVKALQDAGHRVSFVVLRRGSSEVYDELEPIVLGERMVAPWLHGSEWIWPPPLAFWKLMRELRPDLVVSRNPYTAFGWLGFATARLGRARFVLYDQYPMYRYVSRKRTFVNSLVARMARGNWITPVLGRPEEFTKPSIPLRYVPFVMESQTPPESKQWFGSGVVSILSIGKFQARKNHDMFLEAIARLSRRYALRATIIGECTTDERRREFTRVQEIQEALGLGGTVRIMTNLPYHDVQAQYASHDLFVLPSVNEPAAVSHLEAMAHSLPVICSDSNGTRCYIRHGENGYVFRSGDAAHLEDCMEKIIGDRTRLVQMGEKSHDLVVMEHTPARYVEAMLEIARGNG